MARFYDCPSCACLVRLRDPSCPFCDAPLRSGAAPSWLALGLTLGLGAATMSCGEKDEDTMESSTTEEGSTTEGTTAATEMTTSSSSEGTGDTTIDDLTTSSTSTSSSTTSSSTTWDTADASTYAGPDETATIDPHAEAPAPSY